ncbi:MAG: translation elongation factor-like protein [Candidatus Bathyarchaeia archaeon]
MNVIIDETMTLKEVGRVTHYYPKIGVVVVEQTAPLRVGDRIRIMGYTTDFEQTVESMEIEHETIDEAKPGDSIGLKAKERAREKDVVYKIIE